MACISFVFCLSVFAAVLLPFTTGQTVCSYRIPVPDLGVCDSIGGLEVNIESSVYETQGNVKGMREYQEDNFKLWNEEISKIVQRSQLTEVGIRDIVEEINYMKTLLSQFTLPSGLSGSFRAVNQGNQTTQLLDAAKITFTTSIASVLRKIQNLTNEIGNDIQQSAASHARWQSKLTSNQQGLVAAENKLKTLEQKIQQAQGSVITHGTVGGVDLTNVTQDVFDVRVHVEAARTIAQRGLDSIEVKTRQMVADEKKTEAAIQALKPQLPSLNTRFQTLTTQLSNLNGTLPVYEKRIDDVINKANADLSPVRQQTQQADASLSALGQTAFNLTLRENTLNTQVKAAESRMVTIKSLVDFSRQLSLGQTTDFLNLKKTERENLRTLLYAFAVTNTFP